MKNIAILAFGLALAPTSACTATSDPAVRVAYCIEDTVERREPGNEPLRASCDLRVPGDCIVVFHPEGELTDEALVAAGLPPSRLEEFRALRLGSNAAIYVLPNDPKTPDSRTTYQNNFVLIPKLMVAVKSGPQPLEIQLVGAEECWCVAGLR